MDGASLDMQGAIVAALKASDVNTLVSGKILDHVPQNTATPYVQVGEDQEIEDGAEGIEGSEFFLTIRVFAGGANPPTTAVGSPQAKRIAAAVKDTLHEAELSLSENRLLVLMFENSLARREPDGITTSIIMVFRALTEPADTESEGS